MCFVCGPTLHLLKLWKKKIKNDMTPLTTFLLWSPKLLSSECFDFIKYFLNSNVIRPSRESIKFMLLQFPKNKIKKKNSRRKTMPCQLPCSTRMTGNKRLGLRGCVEINENNQNIACGLSA